MDETSDILPPNEGNMISESLPIQGKKPLPMTGFVGSHGIKYGRRSRKTLAQALRKIGINSLIFLFQGYSQRQNFLLRQTIKRLHTHLWSVGVGAYQFAAALGP